MLQEELLQFPAGFVARFLRYAERMELYGPDLGMPIHVRWVVAFSNSGSRRRNGIARVFYCMLVGRRIVMLHQFIKKSERLQGKNLRSRESA